MAAPRKENKERMYKTIVFVPVCVTTADSVMIWTEPKQKKRRLLFVKGVARVVWKNDPRVDERMYNEDKREYKAVWEKSSQH